MDAFRQIMGTVEAMRDGRPFSVDGQVTESPDWFDAKFEHYFNRPSLSASGGLSEDERLFGFLLLFLLALAIITRR